MIRSIETHVACLIGGAVIAFAATHILWAAKYHKHLTADRDAKLREAAYVQEKTVRNAELSNTLEQGLVQDAKATDTVVAKAKASLRKTPWVMVEKCQVAGYTIQPGFGPDDWYDAYRLGRDSVLHPDRVRADASVRAPVSASVVPARTAP